jgi:hypothetical protein
MFKERIMCIKINVKNYIIITATILVEYILFYFILKLILFYFIINIKIVWDML